MLINIEGHGFVPGLNKLAPVKGYEASETFIRRMTILRDWRIYEASTGLLITANNVDRILGYTNGGGGSNTGSGGENLKWESLSSDSTD